MSDSLVGPRNESQAFFGAPECGPSGKMMNCGKKEAGKYCPFHQAMQRESQDTEDTHPISLA